MPWIYLTIYKETINEIGTKLVNNNIQLPHLINNLCKKLIYTINVISTEYLDNADIRALMNVMIICVKNINATIIPILNYNRDFFCLLWLLFSIIFVSTPVYTTTPVTHSVILRLQPLNTMLLLSKGICFQEPVNVWMKGLGLS